MWWRRRTVSLRSVGRVCWVKLSSLLRVAYEMHIAWGLSVYFFALSFKVLRVRKTLFRGGGGGGMGVRTLSEIFTQTLDTNDFVRKTYFLSCWNPPSEIKFWIRHCACAYDYVQLGAVVSKIYLSDCISERVQFAILEIMMNLTDDRSHLSWI